MDANGELLRATRLKQGYSLTEIADELGVDKSHLSKIERNLTGTSIKMLRRLSTRYGLKLEDTAPELASQAARQ